MQIVDIFSTYIPDPEMSSQRFIQMRTKLNLPHFQGIDRAEEGQQCNQKKG